MRGPQRYRVSFSHDRHIPAVLWLGVAIFILFSVLQAAWLWHRNTEIGVMQAQLQSLLLLPSQEQRMALPDSEKEQSYGELLDVSTELTRPLHVWMACLRPPDSVPVRINSFDWNVLTSVIDMRLSVHQREELSQYLQAIGAQEYACAASLRQEERMQEGGYQLSLRLYSLHEELISDN